MVFGCVLVKGTDLGQLNIFGELTFSALVSKFLSLFRCLIIFNEEVNDLSFKG